MEGDDQFESKTGTAETLKRQSLQTLNCLLKLLKPRALPRVLCLRLEKNHGRMWSKEKEVHEVSSGGLHVDAEAEKGRSCQAVRENNGRKS